MKIGLVLEGGAMRGLYTAGVLDVFMDNNIEVDGIVGVSAGVLFGCNYPSKQRGRVLRYNKDYIKDKRYMSMHSLLTTGNFINKDFAFYDLPFNLDIFDEKAFEESGIDFYATVTNVETGKAEYIKIDNILEQMEVLRATSALPYISEMIELESGKYMDGGISDSIPVEKCKELGYDKIIVVLTRPIDYRKKKGNIFLPKLIYRTYPNLIKAINERYKNYNESVEKVIEMEKNKEIFVIRPSRMIKIKKMEKDIDKLQEVYDIGIHDAQNLMGELKQYIKNM